MSDPIRLAVLVSGSGTTLQNLIELDVTKNGLKDGLKPLADRRTLPRLAAARVFGNRFGRDLQRKLTRRPGVYV